MSSSTSYYAKGKFLLSSEYFVLDGALALALPLRFGQKMEVQICDASKNILWKSFDYKKAIWFEAIYDSKTLAVESTNDATTAERLKDIFKSIQNQQPNILDGKTGYLFKSYLDFPRPWGLGTSSTLLSLLAQWSKADAYQVLNETFGGSGYDIACANAEGPIFFQRVDEEIEVNECAFSPSYSEQLYFVYLGKKQNSREGIAHYRALDLDKSIYIERFSEISAEILAAENLHRFDELIQEHEMLISTTLNIPRAKYLYFPDFEGEVKSLGAWGGDFVLVTSKESPEKTKAYFNEKGFEVFYRYDDMVWNGKPNKIN